MSNQQTNKTWQCDECSKWFKTKAAMKQHELDAHENPKGLPKDIRREIASEVFADLPDGAFFAASEDMFGLSTEDWIE